MRASTGLKSKYKRITPASFEYGLCRFAVGFQSLSWLGVVFFGIIDSYACDLTDPVQYDHWLCRIHVGELWGVGRASLAKLEAMGVDSVADLRDLDPRPVRTLIKAARHGVAKTWRDQSPLPWRYSKAGVITTDLVPLSESPRALIGRLDRERSGPLMEALDACNARWGRGAVVPARAGLATKREWNTKFEMRTPCYTTRVGDLPLVQA